MCLQGANLGKALKTWLESLKWPPDAKENDASDWGMSWIEMAVSFYLATGLRVINFQCALLVQVASPNMHLADRMRPYCCLETEGQRHCRVFVFVI